MEFLYFLENLRTPVWDKIWLILTNLGDEPVFLILGLLIFWCVDKLEGYYLITVGLAGTVLNQTLKVACRIPRPWVLDSDFSVVSSAKARATGYSFPSGHTQVSVGTFGAIALWEKNRIIKILCIIICLIVPFSRMYLGVHTPLDVGVSAFFALVFVFSFYPIIRTSAKNAKVIPIFLAVLTCLLAASLLYMHLWHFPADIDMENLTSGRLNLWKLFGASLGLLAAYAVDARYIRFKTQAPLPAQILKFLLGAILVLLLKGGLKPLFDILFGELLIKHALRYGITVFFACGIWPMTFRYFTSFFQEKA